MKDQPEQLDFEERALLRSSYYFRNLIKMVGVWGHGRLDRHPYRQPPQHQPPRAEIP